MAGERGSFRSCDTATSVCAMRDAGEGGWSLAPFSSRGPTADGRIKPDLCAPGYRISAPRAGTADRYTTMNGTSMATPFVAGAAALLLEANPYLTAEEVRLALVATAQDWGAPGKDNDYGHGLVDVYRAAQEVLDMAGNPPEQARHAVLRGALKAGEDVFVAIPVKEAGAALALTLVLPDTPEGKYDFDLYLYDEEGTKVAHSMNTGRQEQIHARALRPGKYFAKVHGFVGSGAFTLDVSWK